LFKLIDIQISQSDLKYWGNGQYWGSAIFYWEQRKMDKCEGWWEWDGGGCDCHGNPSHRFTIALAYNRVSLIDKAEWLNVDSLPFAHIARIRQQTAY
jgi:hypothetical protein